MLIASPDKAPSAAADTAACDAMLRSGSHTFFAASLVLPGALRKPASALYAYCRTADDAIDQGHDRSAALADLRRRLELIYRGQPDSQSSDRAFADAVTRFDIPKSVPLALLEGFAWDAESRQYESFSQLVDYAVRVAGTVGMMMAMIMGIRDSGSLARAADLGVAMQLTNIARDVGEDARCGRLYLPLQWLREAGIDPQAWLARPVYSEPLARVISRLLCAAEILYNRSESGLARLPSACRPAMYAARYLYAEIGSEVARRKFDSVGQRAVVAWPRKARLIAAAVFAAVARRAPIGASEALAEADFLLAPLCANPTLTAASIPVQRGRRSFRGPRFEQRVVWLLTLFEKLERLDRRVSGEAYS